MEDLQITNEEQRFCLCVYVFVLIKKGICVFLFFFGHDTLCKREVGLGGILVADLELEEHELGSFYQLNKLAQI